MYFSQYLQMGSFSFKGINNSSASFQKSPTLNDYKKLYQLRYSKFVAEICKQKSVKHAVLFQSHPDTRKIVVDMNLFPFNRILHLTISFGQKIGYATCLVINKNYVMTAAHNIYQRHKKLKTKRAFITQMVNGKTIQIQNCFFPVQYSQIENQQEAAKYNFAVLKTRKDIFYQLDINQQNNEFFIQPQPSFANRQMTIAGYPQDLNKKNSLEKFSLYAAQGIVSCQDLIFCKYKISTGRGQSGSPIFYQQQGNYILVGIHMLGSSFQNIGLLINKQVRKIIFDLSSGQCTFNSIDEKLQKDLIQIVILQQRNQQKINEGKQQRQREQQLKQKLALNQLKKEVLSNQINQQILLKAQLGKSLKNFCRDAKKYFKNSSILQLLFLNKEVQSKMKRSIEEKQIMFNNERYLKQIRKKELLQRLQQISENPALNRTKIRIDKKELIKQIQGTPKIINQINQVVLALLQRIDQKHKRLMQNVKGQLQTKTNSYLGINIFAQYMAGKLSDYHLDTIEDKYFSQVIVLLKAIFSYQLYHQLKKFNIQMPLILVQNNQLRILNDMKSIVALQRYQMHKAKIINKKIEQQTHGKQSFSLMIDQQALSANSVFIRIICSSQNFGQSLKSDSVVDHFYDFSTQYCCSRKVKTQIYKIATKQKLNQGNPAILVQYFDNLGHQKALLGNLYQTIYEISQLHYKNPAKSISIQDGDIRVRRDWIQSIQSIQSECKQIWRKISFLQDPHYNTQKLLLQGWIKCYTPVKIAQISKIIRNGFPFFLQLQQNQQPSIKKHSRQFITQLRAGFLLTPQEVQAKGKKRKIQTLIEVLINPELILSKEVHQWQSVQKKGIQSEMQKIQTICIASKSVRSKLEKLKQKKLDIEFLQLTLEDNSTFQDGALVTGVLARIVKSQEGQNKLMREQLQSEFQKREKISLPGTDATFILQ